MNAEEVGAIIGKSINYFGRKAIEGALLYVAVRIVIAALRASEVIPPA